MSHVVGDFECADFFFDAFLVEVCFWLLVFFVEAERDVDVVHVVFEQRFVDCSVVVEELMPQGV